MTTTLPLCRYGSKCYQRDRAHSDTFSHPCKYGSACYRKDPDHFNRFTHDSVSLDTVKVPKSRRHDESTKIVDVSCDETAKDVLTDSDSDLHSSASPDSSSSKYIDEGEAKRRRRKAEKRAASNLLPAITDKAEPSSKSTNTRDVSACDSFLSDSPKGFKKAKKNNSHSIEDDNSSDVIIDHSKETACSTKKSIYDGERSSFPHSRPLAKGSTMKSGDDLIIDGLKVVFTGTFERGTRRIIEDEAASLGATVCKTVTSKTELLVIGGSARAYGSKEDRAAELGVKVIFEKNWEDLICRKKARHKYTRRVHSPSVSSSHKISSKTYGKRTSDLVPKERTKSSLTGKSDHPRNTNDSELTSTSVSISHIDDSSKPAAAAVGGENESNDDDDDDDDDDELPEPLHRLADGESVDFTSASGSMYKIKRTGDHFYCTCPAWRNQSSPVNARTCKHLSEYLGEEYETARVGHIKAAPLKPRGTPKPKLLLAQRWEPHFDPSGWHMSEKLDGVRAFWNGKSLLSRLGNMFPAPNWFLEALPANMTLDGELFMGRSRFCDTVSVVKSVGSKLWNSVTYEIFDCPSEGAFPFEKRLDILEKWHGTSITSKKATHIRLVQQQRVRDLKHLETTVTHITTVLGGEGVMLRQPNSIYAETRSSTLLKVKRFYDAEAIVIGHIAGKGRHKGSMGAIEVQMECGKKFKLGTGFSDAERRSPPKIGTIVTYKFQELTPDGIPRFASFICVRPDADKPKDCVVPRASADKS